MKQKKGERPLHRKENQILTNLRDCLRMTFSSSSISSNSLKAWLIAVRPRTMIAAVIPVLVGSFATSLPLSEINWGILISALLVAMSLTIAVNLINDALDAKKGKDTAE